MWRLLEYILAATIILFAFTEFFYPLFRGRPLFGSFRKSAKVTANTEAELHRKVDEAREKVRDVKDVQQEVNRNYKSAEELKEEADRLLQSSRGTDPLS